MGRTIPNAVVCALTLVILRQIVPPAAAEASGPTCLSPVSPTAHGLEPRDVHFLVDHRNLRVTVTLCLVSNTAPALGSVQADITLETDNNQPAKHFDIHPLENIVPLINSDGDGPRMIVLVTGEADNVAETYLGHLVKKTTVGVHYQVCSDLSEARKCEWPPDEVFLNFPVTIDCLEGRGCR